MLHASLRDPARVSVLAEAWADTGCIRVDPFLDEDIATAALTAMQAEAMSIKTGAARLRFQYFQLLWQPDEACDHVLCQVGRWLWGDGCDFISRITGMRLGPPASRALHCTLYTRGCYLDPHNDYDGERQVAFVVGMTKGQSPHELGGHLEFLDIGEDTITLRERRAPGWNSLDIFDVSRPQHIHRVPLVTQPLDRRAITGWFYGSDHGPK